MQNIIPKRYRLFQKMATLIFLLFMGMLVLVTVVAHMRPSGSTRQDMAQAESVRRQAVNHPFVAERAP